MLKKQPGFLWLYILFNNADTIGNIMADDSQIDLGFGVNPFEEEFIKTRDGILVSDLSGKVMIVNEEYGKMWQITAKILKTRDFYKFLERASKITREPERHFAECKSVLVRKNGVLKKEVSLDDGRVIDTHSFPMIGSDNGVHGRIWYFRDITEEKRIEDLRNLQGLMMENLAEGVLMARVKDNIIVYANPRMEKIFGYENEEMVGKHISELNAPSEISATAVAEEIVEALGKSGEWRGTVNNIKKDGTVILTNAVVSQFKHSEYGDVWVSIQNDITRQVRVEDNLFNYAQKYRLLFEYSLVPMMLITTGGGILDANNEACKLLGRSLDELRIAGREGVLDANDLRWKKLNEERKKTGKYRGNFAVFHKDGHKIEVEGASVTFLDTFGKEQTHVVLRDLTLNNEYEEKQKESNALYETLFESQEDPVVIWDPVNWKVIKANKVALERLGYKSLKEIQKSGGPHIFSPGVLPNGKDQQVIVIRMGKKAMEKGEAEFKWWHKTKAGIQYPVMVKLTRINVGKSVYLQASISRVKKDS